MKLQAHDDKQHLVGWIPARKGIDQGDWELHDEWFKLAQSLWKMEGRPAWSIDSAADVKGYNAKCDRWYHKENSFLKASHDELHGQSIWSNPDFRKLNPYLEKLSELNRVGVPSCVVVPHLPDKKWWAVLKENFSMVCMIPRKWKSPGGSYMFSRPRVDATTHSSHQGGDRESPGPPPWDVSLWFSKALVATKDFVVGNVNSPSSTYVEPKLDVGIGSLNVFPGVLMGEHVATLMDDGAQVSLISEKVVSQLGLTVDPVNVSLGWFTKGNVQVTKCIRNFPLIIHGHKFTIPSLLVVPLASYDVILGVRWRDHVCMDAKYRNGRRLFMLTSDTGTRVTLSPSKHKPRSALQDEPVKVCNLVQADRLLSMKGTTAMVLLVEPLKDVLNSGEEVEDKVDKAGKLSLQEQMNNAISSDCPAHLRSRLLSLLNRFQAVFAEPQGVPKFIPDYIRLQLAPHATPFASSPYKMSAHEVEALAALLDDFIRKGWIERSSGEWASPVLLIRKKNGGWRLVVDYRQLNVRTLADQYPLPRIDCLLDRMRNKCWFSAMDLAQGYHQLGLPEHTRDMTSFTTPLGLFRYTVVPMGLKQAPAWFSRRMQEVFHHVVAAGDLSTYLDDLLSHTVTPEQHLDVLEQVFQLMLDADLHVSLSKCIFMSRKVTFLGHAVSDAGVSPDTSKVKALLDWPSFKVGESVDTSKLWKFYGLVNWFRKFIPHFSSVAAPLSSLLSKKDGVWTDEHEHAFQSLKHILIQDVTLSCFDPSLETCLWVDASEMGVGGVLLQKQVQTGYWRPVAFESKKLSPREQRWHTRDKELYGFICCLKSWSHYLKGKHFVAITDHHSLTHFATMKVQGARVTRWLEELCGYDFTLLYEQGTRNVVADALSRRPDYEVEQQYWVKSFEQNLWYMKRAHAGVQTGDDVVDRIVPETVNVVVSKEVSVVPQVVCLPVLQDTVLSRAIPAELMQRIVEAQNLDPKPSAALVLSESGLLCTVHGQVWLPPSVVAAVVAYVHSAYSHVGTGKTFSVVKRQFWCPSLHAVVAKVVKECQLCQQCKVDRRPTAGVLKPLNAAVAQVGKFDVIQVDFVWGLPAKHGFTGFMTVTDWYSKLVHAVPCKLKCTAEMAAEMLQAMWIQHYGPPQVVTSDQDIRFVSSMWHHANERLGSRVQLSTPFHPQSQGFVERQNCTLVDCLRAVVLEKQMDWTLALPWVCFSLNNSVQDTIGMSAHEVVFGKALSCIPLTPHLDFPAMNLPSRADIADIDQVVKEKLLRAASDAQASDTHRAVVFKVGDLVWLKTTKLKLKAGVGTKLVPRYLGPFEVESVVGEHAYKLKLPPSLHCRRTWNVSYLKPLVSSGAPMADVVADQQFSLMDLVDDEQPADDHAVDSAHGLRVVDEYYFHKSTRKGREFRVRFKDLTWADAEIVLESDLPMLPGHAAAWDKYVSSLQRSRNR